MKLYIYIYKGIELAIGKSIMYYKKKKSRFLCYVFLFVF